MPAKKSSIKLSDNKNLRLVGLVLAVALFALLGVKLLNNSGASPATPPPVIGYLNYQSMANADGLSVFTSQDNIAGLGAQYVSDIIPGKQLTYVMGGKVVPNTVCYYLRVYNSPKSATQVTSASVTLVGTNNSQTVTLPADDSYREVCVPKGKQAQLPYNVANNSSAAYVLVHQTVLKY
jgi:hypothetical protein